MAPDEGMLWSLKEGVGRPTPDIPLWPPGDEGVEWLGAEGVEWLGAEGVGRLGAEGVECAGADGAE